MNTLHERAHIRAQLWRRFAEESGWWLTPDSMVGLADAATLIGKKPKTLSNLCAAGEGPPTYRNGGTGGDGRRHRVAVSLLDLALWLEMGRRESAR